MSHMKIVKIGWLNFGRKIFMNKWLHFNVDRNLQQMWISKDVFSHHQLPHRILCHKKNAGDCENHTGDCAKDCAVSTYTWQCQSTANGRCKNCCPPTQLKKCGGKNKCNSKAWDKSKPPWNSDFSHLKMDGCKDLSGGRIVAKQTKGMAMQLGPI